MEAKEDSKNKKIMHLTAGAQALVLRIEALIAQIPSDIIRSTVSALLGDAIKSSDERLLRQLLIVAQASIESSELIENKINGGGFERNIFTGELLSELDYTKALKEATEYLTNEVDNVEIKNQPKPTA